MWVGKGVRTGDNVLFFQQFFSTIAPISILNIMLTQSQYTIYRNIYCILDIRRNHKQIVVRNLLITKTRAPEENQMRKYIFVNNVSGFTLEIRSIDIYYL